MESIYAVLPASIVLIIAIMAKNQKIYYAVMIVVCIAGYFGYNQYITSLGVKQTSIAEAISIPLQLCLTDICALYTWMIVLLCYYLISKK